MSTPETEEPRSEEESQMDETRMSLLEHLAELRVRLRNAGIAFLLSMILAFVFVERIWEWLSRPVRAGVIRAGFDPTFIVTGVSEAFWVYFKLAMLTGVLVAAPLIFWELWKFIAPGLYKKERRVALLITGATGICFTGGAIFGYALLTEPAVYYLASVLKSFTPSDIPGGLTPQYRMEEVYGFVSMMLLGCGVAFELPVVLSVLGWLGIVSAKALWKFNRFALVLSALLGGLLTPGADVVSQLLLAGPIFGLYNLSIIVVMLLERARRKKEAALDAEYDAKPGDGPAAPAV